MFGYYQTLKHYILQISEKCLISGKAVERVLTKLGDLKGRHYQERWLIFNNFWMKKLKTVLIQLLNFLRWYPITFISIVQRLQQHL